MSLQQAGDQRAIVAQLRAELFRAITQSAIADSAPDRSDRVAGTAACYLIALGAACVCAALWTQALGAVGCHVAPVPVTLGVDANAAVSMPAGAPCTVILRTGQAMIEDLTVTVSPAHGTVAARGRTGVVYRPQRQFRGDDRFSFSVRGRLGPAFETSVVRVQVSVR